MAFLVISVLTGLVSAAVGYFGFGGGLLALSLWYVAGCWAGFAASIAAYLIVGAGKTPHVPQWPDRPAVG